MQAIDLDLLLRQAKIAVASELENLCLRPFRSRKLDLEIIDRTQRRRELYMKEQIPDRSSVQAYDFFP